VQAAGSALRACTERCDVAFSYPSGSSNFQLRKQAQLATRVRRGCKDREQALRKALRELESLRVLSMLEVLVLLVFLVLLQRQVECGMVWKESDLNSDFTAH